MRAMRIGKERKTGGSALGRGRASLHLEALEARWLPSGFYTVTNLVSDQAGQALIQDSSLVNAWGIALGPTGGNFWVSDNGTGVTTLYHGDVNGSAFAKTNLTVSIPNASPTGQVFNPTSDFVVSDGAGNSGPAIFIFASESGTISGWNPNVPPPSPSTQAQIGTTVPGAIFKGLAIGSNSTGNFLYATDFHNGKIDVFDKNFNLTTLDGSFTDPDIPNHYAPFNIENLGGKLYVTYAKQDHDAEDDVHGPNHGFVDVFDTDGHLLQRLITRHHLDSPWGMAIAPSNFGQFSNDLLVGQFGSGHINVFDPNTGAFLGRLKGPDGKQLVIDGLWGLTFGNGVTAGDTNTLYFSAGPGDEQHGLFGKIVATQGASGDVAPGIVLASMRSSGALTSTSSVTQSAPTRPGLSPPNAGSDWTPGVRGVSASTPSSVVHSDASGAHDLSALSFDALRLDAVFADLD